MISLARLATVDNQEFPVNRTGVHSTCNVNMSASRPWPVDCDLAWLSCALWPPKKNQNGFKQRVNTKCVEIEETYGGNDDSRSNSKGGIKAPVLSYMYSLFSTHPPN